MAMLLAATLPERVSALVLYGTTPRFVRSPDWDFGWTPDHQISFGANAGAIIDEIEQFLTGALGAHDTDRVLATVLFTDIVDSTRRAAELGDSAWRPLLDRHDEVVRRQLDRFRGREVKVVGDGFVATFDAGMAVHIGARVAALASAGEVLVSSAVPPLVAGSGLTFTDRGYRELKGVDGEWKIFGVGR